MAEAGGFEPPIPFWSIAVFETAPFDHSGTPPLYTGQACALTPAPY